MNVWRFRESVLSEARQSRLNRQSLFLSRYQMQCFNDISAGAVAACGEAFSQQLLIREQHDGPRYSELLRQIPCRRKAPSRPQNMGNQLDQYLRAPEIEIVPAYLGIDRVGYDVVLRSASDPETVEHCVLNQQPEALTRWSKQLQHRFGSKGKVLICLEQSLGFVINHLTGYECFELYPVNSVELRRYRETFSVGGNRDKRPDAELLCALLYRHCERLRTLFGN